MTSLQSAAPGLTQIFETPIPVDPSVIPAKKLIPHCLSYTMTQSDALKKENERNYYCAMCGEGFFADGYLDSISTTSIMSFGITCSPCSLGCALCSSAVNCNQCMKGQNLAEIKMFGVQTSIFACQATFEYNLSIFGLIILSTLMPFVLLCVLFGRLKNKMKTRLNIANDSASRNYVNVGDLFNNVNNGPEQNNSTNHQPLVQNPFVN